MFYDTGKGTMNKFRFLLTCSNEQDDLIKNINTSQEDGDVFDKWRIPRSSNSSQINCAHTKLTSVFCTSVLDSSSFPVQPPPARAFPRAGEGLRTEPF